MPSSIAKLQQHVYAMFSGATLKVVSNPHDPICLHNSSQRLSDSPTCWESDGASLSEHLSYITQVLPSPRRP
jgi:hypothetical protein